MLRFDRKQQNSVKQLSFIKNKLIKKKTAPSYSIESYDKGPRIQGGVCTPSGNGDPLNIFQQGNMELRSATRK